MRAVTLRGIVALVGLLACAGAPPDAEDVVGTYRGDLPGITTPGRAVTLELGAGNTARMAVDDQTGLGPTVETGTWSLTSKGEIRVVLARDGFGPVTSDVTFRWAHEMLTAIAFDTLRWGGRGFALARD
jgi:hypothetical protein